MKPAEAKEIIKKKVELLAQLTEGINVNFDEMAISQFRQEFRIVRSFLTFMRLQRNDKHIKMPETCKHLYHLAGKIKDIATEIKDNTTDIDNTELQMAMQKVHKDWRKNYSVHTFPKFQSKIVELNYSKLNPDLLDNFFGNIKKSESLED